MRYFVQALSALFVFGILVVGLIAGYGLFFDASSVWKTFSSAIAVYIYILAAAGIGGAIGVWKGISYNPFDVAVMCLKIPYLLVPCLLMVSTTCFYVGNHHSLASLRVAGWVLTGIALVGVFLILVTEFSIHKERRRGHR